MLVPIPFCWMDTKFCFILCFAKERKPYWFGITWESVNDTRIFCLGWHHFKTWHDFKKRPDVPWPLAYPNNVCHFNFYYPCRDIWLLQCRQKHTHMYATLFAVRHYLLFCWNLLPTAKVCCTCCMCAFVSHKDWTCPLHSLTVELWVIWHPVTVMNLIRE